MSRAFKLLKDLAGDIVKGVEAGNIPEFRAVGFSAVYRKFAEKINTTDKKSAGRANKIQRVVKALANRIDRVASGAPSTLSKEIDRILSSEEFFTKSLRLGSKIPSNKIQIAL